MKAPSVVLFKNGYIGKNNKNSIRFSRKNVWLRDEGKCQYCFKNVTFSTFTIDHVIPKTHGGQTCWNNVVTSCYSCNQKKGNKSLKDSGFQLIKAPRKPARLPYMQELSDGNYNPEKGIPNSWKFYLER
jgi:5-methylcytosine-specific restriction endonuclease McrA